MLLSLMGLSSSKLKLYNVRNMANDQEEIKLKEEVTGTATPPDQGFQPDMDQFANDAINRRLYPIGVPLVGRSIKSKDVFVISGLVAASATVTSISTDVNTTTETNLATFTFLPDELHKGILIRITAIGTYTSDGTRIPTIRVGSGTAPTTEWNSMVATAASTTNQPWNLEWTGIVSGIGSSGTLEAQMRGKINNVNKDDPNTATITINTTTSLIIAVTAQWSASNAGNSISIRQFIVETL